MGEAEGEQNAAVTLEVPLPKTHFYEYLFFYPFVIVFTLILVVFDPLQRIALLFSQKLQQRVVCGLNFCLMHSLHILGVRFEIEGQEHIPENVPLLVISNHQALFDIPILHTVFAKCLPRFVAKQELAKWIPSVSFNIRHGGSAAIDRSNPRQAVPEIQALAGRMLEQRFAVVIFPEGTRAREGTLKSFRSTGVSTFVQSSEAVHVIPVALDNTWVLSARPRGPIPLGVTVKVRVLAELDRNRITAKELVRAAESRIQQALQDLRAQK